MSGDPYGTGDLFADAALTVATTGGPAKGDTSRAKPPEASAWAWCPRCGPARTQRLGLIRGGRHYLWRQHNKARQFGGSVICQASGTALCDTPPTRCDACHGLHEPCAGDHQGPVLLRKPTRAETTEATAHTRIPHPVDGTCIDMHEPAQEA